MASRLAAGASTTRARVRKRTGRFVRGRTAAQQARVHERRLQPPAAAVHAYPAPARVRSDTWRAARQAELSSPRRWARDRARNGPDIEAGRPPPGHAVRIREPRTNGVLGAAATALRGLLASR